MEGTGRNQGGVATSTEVSAGLDSRTATKRIAPPSAAESAGGKHDSIDLRAAVFSVEKEHASGAEIIDDGPEIDATPAKVGYFGQYFSLGSLIPYYGVIFASKGMSPGHIGFLLSFIPLVNIMIFPTITYVADRFKCSKGILRVSSVLCSFFAAAFLLSSTTTAALISFPLFGVSRSSINPLLDQLTASIFPKERKVKEWGALRSFGALGWGVGSAVCAAVVDWRSTWAWTPLLFGAGQVGVLHCVAESKPYEVPEELPMQFHEVFLFVVRHKRLLLFLTATCFMGEGFTIVDNFLFVFLETLGASKMLMGLSLALTVSIEIPIFQLSKFWQNIFTDRQMLSISMATWVVRVVGYSLLKNPWFVLLLEPLHGFSFGFTWIPAVHVVNTVFPLNLSNSATGFLYLFVNGIGPITGSVVCGALYERFGPRIMFRTAAIFISCMLFLFICLDRYLERKEAEGACVVDDVECAESEVATVKAHFLEEREGKY